MSAYRETEHDRKEREMEDMLFLHHVAAAQMQAAEKQHPSVAAIPKFFSGGSSAAPSASKPFGASGPSAMQALFWLESFARHLESEVKVMLGYRRPLLVARSASNPAGVSYRDMEEDWRSAIRDVELELRNVLVPLLGELMTAQSPPEDMTRRINYDLFVQLRDEARHKLLDRLMTGSAFISFTRDKYGRISTDSFRRWLYNAQYKCVQMLDLEFFAYVSALNRFTMARQQQAQQAQLARRNKKDQTKQRQQRDRENKDPQKKKEEEDAAAAAAAASSSSSSSSSPPSPSPASPGRNSSPNSPQSPSSSLASSFSVPPLQAGTIPASPVNPADFGQKLLLSEDELIKWIRSRLLHDTACPLLRPEHEDDFFGIYVFTAARRFLFFLDPKKTRQVSVEHLLWSPITAELLDFAHLIHHTEWPDSPSSSNSSSGAGGGVSGGRAAGSERADGEGGNDGEEDAKSAGESSSSANDRLDNPNSRHYVRYHSVISDLSDWAQSSRRFVSFFVGTRPTLSSNPSYSSTSMSSSAAGDDESSSSTAAAASRSSSKSTGGGEGNASRRDRDNPPSQLRDVVMMLFTPSMQLHRERVGNTLRDAVGAANSGVAIRPPIDRGPCPPSSVRMLHGPAPRIDREHPGVATLDPQRADWVLCADEADDEDDDEEDYVDDLADEGEQLRRALAKRACLRVSLFQTNWFSADTPNSYYREYLELDRDENGMISKQELALFRRQVVTADGFVTGGMYGPAMRLTEAFLDRIFDEIVTFRAGSGGGDGGRGGGGDGEMDYRLFLDFVLAVESIETPQGLHYFWKLLNLSGRGLDKRTLSYFYRDVAAGLKEMDYESAEAPDVIDEIFDMVGPADPSIITFEDLLACKVGHTVISMLIDVEGFSVYDRREQNLHDGDDDEEN